jgi:hypothetical protein
VFLFLLGFLLRCHGSILPSIVHGLSNGVLLQLIECIESIKSDVKKKMMLTRALERCTKVTGEEKSRIVSAQSKQIMGLLNERIVISVERRRVATVH